MKLVQIAATVTGFIGLDDNGDVYEYTKPHIENHNGAHTERPATYERILLPDVSPREFGT